MKINTAADLAAILDPEHKVQGWWKIESSNRRSDCTTNWYTYIGPPDLHTAREHDWRKEEWLDSKGCSIVRYAAGLTVVFDSHPSWGNRLSKDPNHSAALVAAIERVHNSDAKRERDGEAASDE